MRNEQKLDSDASGHGNGPTGPDSLANGANSSGRLRVRRISTGGLSRKAKDLLVSLLFDYSPQQRSQDPDIFNYSALTEWLSSITGVVYTTAQVRELIFVEVGCYEFLASIVRSGRGTTGLITRVIDSQSWEVWDDVLADLGIVPLSRDSSNQSCHVPSVSNSEVFAGLTHQ